MVEIISKSDAPRREDVVAKRIIHENKSTIHRLADQLSGGEFSRSRAALRKGKEEPQPEGLSIHLMGGSTPAPRQTLPVVRVSVNERVIVVDDNSGKQLMFLGQMKTAQDGQRFFSLATKENGYFSPLDEDVQQVLSDLNGVVVESLDIEKKFINVIGTRLFG